ncbi:MAG: FAD-dependent oxidoreductase [Candidatus Gribaldobacteria bacterium]|nr:FAD-dependent oxidoreductase [Candidatus Gribaldobacteria bacterium]
MMYDLIIIGGGPAGITAGIYASRKKLKTLIIAKDFFGQIAKTHRVDNWPGDLGISEMDLMRKMEKHLKSFSIEIKADQKVVSVKAEGGSLLLAGRTFVIQVENGESFEAKAVIIATGRAEKKLGVLGEEELIGKGVSYCSICDAPFFTDKKVAVIGSGNSALDSAKYAAEVCLFFQGEKVLGDECSQELIKQQTKIKFYPQTEIKAIGGAKKVESLTYQEIISGEEKQISVDGVFINIGSVPVAGLVGDLVARNEKGEIVVDSRNNVTSQVGIFAVGDVTDSNWKQLILASADGAKAALAVYEYLQNK